MAFKFDTFPNQPGMDPFLTEDEKYDYWSDEELRKRGKLPPGASDELKEEWGGAGGYGPEKADRFLMFRGYKPVSGCGWIKPASYHKPSGRELRAIQFLVDEWGYKGLI